MNKLEKALLKCEIKAAGDGTYDFVMSDETIDRDGEVIVVEGWDLKNFRANSILLWGHRHDIPGIGEVGKVAKEDGKLVAHKVRFATEGIYDLADTVHGLVDDGILKAVSVGYIPKEREFPAQDDGDKSKKKKPQAQVVTNKAELYELSIVNVGSNPNALRAVKTAEEKASKGFTGDERQYLKDIFTEEKGIETDTEKPYPNEHACRLRNPDDFKKGSFKRYTRTHEGKKYSIIAGKLKGKDTMTEQAYRYDKEVWEAAEARKHCKDHDGSFEAAGKDIEEVSLQDVVDMLKSLEEKIDGIVTKMEQRPRKYDSLLAVGGRPERPAEKQRIPLKQPARATSILKYEE